MAKLQITIDAPDSIIGQLARLQKTGPISPALLGEVLRQENAITSKVLSLSADGESLDEHEAGGMSAERRGELLGATATGRAALENDPDYAAAKRSRDAALRARGFEP